MADFSEYVRLDGDILTPYAGQGQLFVFDSPGFWEQVKTPAMMLRAAELYLGSFKTHQPALLTVGGGPEGPLVKGNVYVHSTARIHPTAMLGPNCSVAPGVVVGAGARLANCIVLDGAQIGKHAVVSHAIVGWKCNLGAWCRVQGSADYEAKLGVAILGEDVCVADEVRLFFSLGILGFCGALTVFVCRWWWCRALCCRTKRSSASRLPSAGAAVATLTPSRPAGRASTTRSLCRASRGPTPKCYSQITTTSDL